MHSRVLHLTGTAARAIEEDESAVQRGTIAEAESMVERGAQDAVADVGAMQTARDRLVAAFGAAIEAEAGENDSEDIVAAKNLRLSLDVRLQNSCVPRICARIQLDKLKSHATFWFIYAVFSRQR